ncbi:uncharacterized protein TNCV_1012191 [Trichonephila clavipes]|uniref:Uncharacterized protein n=1 Tax=Trichonephila clavipes TaxID=2585209 RepID=A0A8X7B9F9_TRICX|nr:uncharacterized protein TNCV_1012191 [Trichonephila clavipes]
MVANSVCTTHAQSGLPTWERRHPETITHRKVLSPDEISNFLRELSENESEGSEQSCSTSDSFEDYRVQKANKSVEVTRSILIKEVAVLQLNNQIKKRQKDFNDDHREEITDFVQSIPGFQECDEACNAEDCGFQMLNDDEIVTSVKEESDPVDDEMDEGEDNNNKERIKGPSIAN